ncbi:kinesin K39 [Novymonas esmeraldas]|uniref:Kinesin K39 n=1 Tax=Novymonas esmeraldas TaxID=1808958 RepID=A0AAW0FAE1_9TRYP
MPAAAASGAAPRREAERVKVSVRVRPLNARETAAPAGTAVAVSANQGTAVVTMATVGGGAADTPGAAKRAAQDFQFDHVFWSVDAPDACGAAPATQVDVFKTIGYPLVQHAFDGFNSCLFAYGQTGSGKTHTMMGADVGALCGEGSGVTPRICLEIFARKAGEEAAGHSRWSVELGYVEVYNERVSDLLARRRKGAKAGGGGGAGEEVYVDVREHPSRGVFLEGQRLVEVTSLEDVVRLIELGNGVRHTAATKMNDRSSRSHAIIMLLLREERTMTTKGGDAIRTAGKSSRMNLVDLAGSERVAQSQVEGQQFKEATHINLSLTTLGRVIDVLADMAKRGARAPYSVAPYRDSKLTFILKDSLGGNSKTFMVATVSPSALNYEETLSTLRYASRARDIVNVAQVNEDPRARRIRELEEQMAGMRETMAGGDPAYVQELEEKLALLESEAQKRAADLQALEKEKEKNEIRDLMLKATEAERLELQSRADALERQALDSRAQAARAEQENRRMLALQREKDELLREREASLERHRCEMRRRESSMANHREAWQVSLEQQRCDQQTVLLQLIEAEERCFRQNNFFHDYITEVRRCWSATVGSAVLRCRQGEEASAVTAARMTSTAAALQDRLDLLERQLHDAQSETERLTSAADTAAAEHALARAATEQQLAELHRQQDAGSAQITALKDTLDAATNAAAQANAARDAAVRTIEELDAAISDLRTRHTALEVSYQQALADNDTANSVVAQQQKNIDDLQRHDERWALPDIDAKYVTTAHTQVFPQSGWETVLQKTPLELHRTFTAEAALACHVRPSDIQQLHFHLGSLHADFHVRHPHTVTSADIDDRLSQHPFRAMQDLLDHRTDDPHGLDALTSTIADKTAATCDLRNVLAATTADKERLQSELEEKGSEADAAKEDNEALRGQLEDATQQLEEANADKERLQSELEEKGSEADAAKEDNEALRGQLEDANQQIADATQQLEEANADKERLQSELEEKGSEADAAKEDNEALRGQLEDANQQLEEANADKERLQSELEEKGSEADAAKEDNEALRGQLEDANQQIADATQQLEEANADKERLQSELEEKGSEADAAKEDNEALRGQLDDANQQIADATQQLEDANERTCVLCDEKDVLMAGYVAAERERLKLQVRFDARREVQKADSVWSSPERMMEPAEKRAPATVAALKALGRMTG